MKTPISVMDSIYQILNVSEITSLLDGGIYRGFPFNNTLFEKKNILINSLNTTNGDYIHEHIINVNVFAPDLPNGQADEDTLNTIGNAVIAKLEEANSKNYIQIIIVSNAIIIDDNNNSYLNIRLEIITE